MEKQQLIKFVAKVMEDSGFKVYKNFKTANKIIDIYAVLPSEVENFGVIVACKNYEKEFEVGIDVLKDMEETKEAINASKITIVTSSSFSPEAIQYAETKNIKLVDREGLTELVKKYQNKKEKEEKEEDTTNERIAPYEENNSQTIHVDTPPINDVYDEEVVKDFMNNVNYENTNQRSSIFGGSSKKTNILNKQTSSMPSFGGNNSKNSLGLNIHSSHITSYLNNTIVLIILVTLISFVIASLLIYGASVSASTAGIVELLITLALSYGIILFINRDGGQILVKGTIIFFVSLILLMILNVIF